MREKKAKAIDRGQENRQIPEKSAKQNAPLCRVCGKILLPEECNWEGAAGTGMLCRYCKAEGNSCGCSD